jgi:hypothetical protein
MVGSDTTYCADKLLGVIVFRLVDSCIECFFQKRSLDEAYQGQDVCVCQTVNMCYTRISSLVSKTIVCCTIMSRSRVGSG